MDYVLIKNEGVCDDWSSLDTNKNLQDEINRLSVKVINFPRFIGNKTRNTIDEKDLTFGKAKEYEGFSTIDRQRVKSFLKKAYQAFYDSGVFQSNFTNSNNLKKIVTEQEKNDAVAQKHSKNTVSKSLEKQQSK